MNLRSFEKVNLRAASIRSNETSESLMLFVKTYKPLILLIGFPVSAYNRVLDSRSEEVRAIQIMPIFLMATYVSTLQRETVSRSKEKRTRFGTGSSNEAGRDNLLKSHQRLT